MIACFTIPRTARELQLCNELEEIIAEFYHTKNC